MTDLAPSTRLLTPPPASPDKLNQAEDKPVHIEKMDVDPKTQDLTPPDSPNKLETTKKRLPTLDVTMKSLDHLDRTGPLTATSGSPFLVSPVVGATLLTSAAKLAKNAAPPLMSPTSPLVWHPISLNRAALFGATSVSGLQPPAKDYSKVIFEGQIRPVSVAALEDLLFLTRIAKWKVAYHEGRPFNRSEQLPYCEWNDHSPKT